MEQAREAAVAVVLVQTRGSALSSSNALRRLRHRLVSELVKAQTCGARPCRLRPQAAQHRQGEEPMATTAMKALHLHPPLVPRDTAPVADLLPGTSTISCRASPTIMTTRTERREWAPRRLGDNICFFS